MDDKEWLAALKVGDKVVVEKYEYGNRYYSMREVEHVTLTQVVARSMVFSREDGTQVRRKKDGSTSSRSRIFQVTDERLNEIRRQQTVAQCKNIQHELNPNSFDRFTLQEATDTLKSLQAIVRIIEDVKPKIRPDGLTDREENNGDI